MRYISSNKSLKIHVLYYMFFSFFLTIFLISRDSLTFQYLTTGVDLIVISTIVLMNPMLYEKSHLTRNYLVLFFITFLICIMAVKGTHVYTPLLFMKIVLVYFFFQTFSFSKKQILNFLNTTYLVYSVISIIVFLFFPTFFYVLADHFLNYVNLGFVKFLVFHSIEGGASTIDSYSALILLANIYLIEKEDKKNYAIIFFSILMIIYSLKMTPLVSLFGSLFLFVFIRNKYTLILTLIILLIGFMIVIRYLFIDPWVFGNVRFSTFMYVVTHARSMIWVQQVQVMIDSFSFRDYLFGNYDPNLFTVQAFQLDGYEKGTTYNNPHNTYLLLLFRSPLLFICMYFSFLRLSFITFERRTSIIVLFIAVTCFSNSSIISLGNPVYLIVLSFIFSLKNAKQ